MPRATSAIVPGSGIGIGAAHGTGAKLDDGAQRVRQSDPGRVERDEARKDTLKTPMLDSSLARFTQKGTTDP